MPNETHERSSEVATTAYPLNSKVDMAIDEVYEMISLEIDRLTQVQRSLEPFIGDRRKAELSVHAAFDRRTEQRGEDRRRHLPVQDFVISHLDQKRPTTLRELTDEFKATYAEVSEEKAKEKLKSSLKALVKRQRVRHGVNRGEYLLVGTPRSGAQGATRTGTDG